MSFNPVGYTVAGVRVVIMVGTTVGVAALLVAGSTCRRNGGDRA